MAGTSLLFTVCFGGAWQAVEAQQKLVNVVLFEEVSNAHIPESECTSGIFENGRCFESDARRTVAVAALLAISDFNGRDGKVVSRFDDADINACDKNMSLAGFWDTQGSGLQALRGVFALSGQKPMHIVIGPRRSDTATVISPILQLASIPMIAASTTSPLLSSTTRFPNFMRTIPSDNAVAYATCKFWGVDLGLLAASVIYVADSFGEGYARAVEKHCVFGGQRLATIDGEEDAAGALAPTGAFLEFQSLAFEQSSAASIASAVAKFKASRVNVALVVALGQDNAAVLEEAYQQGAIRSVPQSLWAISSAATLQHLEALSEAAKRAVSGSMRVTATGAVESNAAWHRFVQRWPSLKASDFNQHLPEYWQVNDTLFTDFDVNASSIAREDAAFTYDAVASAALITCNVAPHRPLATTRIWDSELVFCTATQGPLPADFGKLFLGNKSTVEFTGLSGEVKFDVAGDRAASSAHFLLTNVLLQRSEGATSGSRALQYVRKAEFKNDSWVWYSGKLDFIFNHDATDLPVDILAEPSLPPPPPPPPAVTLSSVGRVSFFVLIVLGGLLLCLSICAIMPCSYAAFFRQ
eukprot:3421658-Pleurochrysis_carterae.AAC.3